MRKMIDILIEGGTLITMDPQRRIIQKGDIAIENNVIIDIDASEKIKSKYQAKKTIKAENHVIMPGLIDTHGHSGHSMVKTIGEHFSGWGGMIENLYNKGVTDDFWYADSLVASLEKLKFGTTTGAYMLGGGSGQFRTDDPKFSDLNAKAVKEVGIRGIIGLGPIGRAPFTPRDFTQYENGAKTDKTLDFSDMLKTTRKVVNKYNDFGQLVTARVSINSISPDLKKLSEAEAKTVKGQAKEIKTLVDETGRGILAHGSGGTMSSALELGLLGPKVNLAHSTGMTAEDIAILKKTGATISHCPRAHAIMRTRCPVVELLDAGVLVALGTDGSSPDRTFDMFADMRMAQTLQRHYFHDASYMPAGKVLEMATVDAAKALGLESEIGSLEIGKRADMILINLKKAHLTPYFMVPFRVVYEAYGHDVDTSIVNGKIVMENRVVKNLNEEKALDFVQKVAEETIRSNDLEKYMGQPKGFWGSSKYL